MQAGNPPVCSYLLAKAVFISEVNMDKYHKIQTVFKRDPETKFRTLLEGDYALPEFEFLKDNSWIFTEKVDGTNIRVMYDGKSIIFGGKSDNSQIPAFLVNSLQNIFLCQKLKFKEIFEENSNVCLYGEGYGAKIQKGGGNYRADQGFVLFDVKIDNIWLQRKDVVDIADKLKIDIVPVIGKGNLLDMVKMVQEGFNSRWGDFKAEGIVARPAVGLMTRSGERIITKIKVKDFSQKT